MSAEKLLPANTIAQAKDIRIAAALGKQHRVHAASPPHSRKYCPYTGASLPC